MSYWDEMMKNGKNPEDIAGNEQELQGHYTHVHTAAFQFITLILLMRITLSETSSRQEKNSKQHTSARTSQQQSELYPLLTKSHTTGMFSIFVCD